MGSYRALLHYGSHTMGVIVDHPVIELERAHANTLHALAINL
jgi:hypothetical protein